MKSFSLALVVVTVGGMVAADLPTAWQHWRYFAPIAATPVTTSRLVSVLAPTEVTTKARQGWADLRVIDSQDREVAYVLRAHLGGTSFKRRPVPLLEPSAAAGSSQQAIADTGAQGDIHNSVKLNLQTSQNLMTYVEIAVSSDLRDWRVVRDRAPIYVLRAEGQGEKTDVSYPDSASRYVRLRILDGSDSYRLVSAEIGVQTATVAERAPAGIPLSTLGSSQESSVWISSGDASALPVSRVEFTTTEPAFSRSAVVETSDRGDRWAVVGRGDILRSSAGIGDRAWLAVDFPEAHAARWRVTVKNGSNAPLADVQPTLMTAPRRVVFRQEPGESYRLLYGHPRAGAPTYDMIELTDVKLIDAAVPASLGAEVENAGWVDPAPWTERHEGVLWVALVLSALTLALAAIRTLRPPPQKTGASADASLD